MFTLSDLSKLSTRLLAFYFLLALLISSGYLLIYFFASNFFITSDFWKLLLLSFSLSMPLLVLNIVIIMCVTLPPQNIDSEASLFLLFLGGSTLALFLLYSIISIKIFFNITGRTALIIIGAIEALIIIFAATPYGKKILGPIKIIKKGP